MKLLSYQNSVSAILKLSHVEVATPIVWLQIRSLRVGVLSGEEEKVDGYVWQSDHNGIKVSWVVYDHQSGVTGLKYAVGTSPGINYSDSVNYYPLSTHTYTRIHAHTHIHTHANCIE